MRTDNDLTALIGVPYVKSSCIDSERDSTEKKLYPHGRYSWQALGSAGQRNQSFRPQGRCPRRGPPHERTQFRIERSPTCLSVPVVEQGYDCGSAKTALQKKSNDQKFQTPSVLAVALRQSLHHNNIPPSNTLQTRIGKIGRYSVNDDFVFNPLSDLRKCLEEAGEAVAVVAEAAAEDAAADQMCPGIQAMSPMLVLPSCSLYVGDIDPLSHLPARPSTRELFR